MSSDVLIVGGGAIGVAVAYELARDGASVMLLERGPELATGCSAGSAGLICPSHSVPLASPAALRQGARWAFRRDSPLSVRPRPALIPWLARFAVASTQRRAHAGTDAIRSLSIASLARHAMLADAGLDTGFARHGTLNVYATEEGLAAGRVEADRNRDAGLRVEEIEPAAARELEPALGSAVGTIFYPDEAHLDSKRFVDAVGQAAREAGVRIETGVEVLDVVGSRHRIDGVRTREGHLRAGAVVVAAGAWTPSLLARLGVFVPVEAAKGYHVDVDHPAAQRIPLFFQEARVIATPLDGRLRLAGTLELSGLDLRPDPVRVQALLRAGTQGLVGFASTPPPVRTVWCGLRPCAPDGLPIVGRPTGFDNLVLATGHAMMGLTLAPITGRLVADLVGGRRPSADAEPLSPDRFRPLLSLRTRRG